MSPSKLSLLALWAVTVVALSSLQTCDAQGQASGLHPYYPSWQRVIEQLKAVTQSYGQSAAQEQQTLLLPGRDVSSASQQGSLAGSSSSTFGASNKASILSVPLDGAETDAAEDSGRGHAAPAASGKASILSVPNDAEDDVTASDVSSPQQQQQQQQPALPQPSSSKVSLQSVTGQAVPQPPSTKVSLQSVTGQAVPPSSSSGGSGTQVSLQAFPKFPKWPQQPSQQQQQQQQHAAAGGGVSTPTAEEAKSADESDKQVAAQKILPREPLHVSPPPSTTAVTSLSVDTSQQLLQIPSSFLGISHEWPHVQDLAASPGYKAAIKLLSSYGTGPFGVRVGGGSTDSTKEVLPYTVYKALRQLYQEAGVRFILGLNFEDVNLKLTQAQMLRAQKSLPDDAVVTFELGNEPNFYAKKKNMTALEYSRCCFTTEWAEFARNLSCTCATTAFSEDCCTESLFAGPVWGHINVYPSTFKWFLDNAAQYVSLVTVHWYKAQKEAPNTPASLLDEAPIRTEMDNLRQLVQVANSFGKPLRVAEMNTISNSGLLGVSNVFAAALWTLDGAFEVAAAGAVGVNLHQGAGQNLYTAILRKEEGGKLKPVVLRPSFYGMLMFQQAVRGGAILLNKQQLVPSAPTSADIKVWPLLDSSTGELRVVLINKHAKQAATQVLKLAADSSSSYQSVARLSRLVAQGEDPLAATKGITLGGHYYAAGCEQQGAEQTLVLEADPVGPSTQQQLTWSIYLPPGSATLVRIQPKSQAV